MCIEEEEDNNLLFISEELFAAPTQPVMGTIIMSASGIKHQHPFVITGSKIFFQKSEEHKTQKPLTTNFLHTSSFRWTLSTRWLVFFFVFRYWRDIPIDLLWTAARYCLQLIQIEKSLGACSVHRSWCSWGSLIMVRSRKKKYRQGRRLLLNRNKRNECKHASEPRNSHLAFHLSSTDCYTTPSQAPLSLETRMIINGISLMQHWRATRHTRAA